MILEVQADSYLGHSYYDNKSAMHIYTLQLQKQLQLNTIVFCHMKVCMTS